MGSYICDNSTRKRAILIACDTLLARCKSSDEARKFGARGLALYLRPLRLGSDNEGVLRTVNARKDPARVFRAHVRAGRCARRLPTYLPRDPAKSHASLISRGNTGGWFRFGSLESLKRARPGPPAPGYSAARKRARGTRCSRWLQRPTDFAPAQSAVICTVFRK